jgi:hypothetical protein
MQDFEFGAGTLNSSSGGTLFSHCFDILFSRRGLCMALSHQLVPVGLIALKGPTSIGALHDHLNRTSIAARRAARNGVRALRTKYG